MALRYLLAILSCAAAIGATGCAPGLSPSGPTPVDAKNITWEFVNSSGVAVNLRFFDRTTGAVWPGTGSYWTLDVGDRQSYRLSCNDDSKICFGASAARNANVYWGIGLDGRNGCDDCCHTCGAGNPTPRSLR